MMRSHVNLENIIMMTETFFFTSTCVMKALTAQLYLICSGDVETNPGPLGEQELLTFAALLKESLELAAAVATNFVSLRQATQEKISTTEGTTVNATACINKPKYDQSATNEGTEDDDKSLNVDELSDLEEETIAMLGDLSLVVEEQLSDLVIDPVVDLMIELVQIMSTLKEMFLKSSRADQEVLSSQVTAIPDAIDGFYGLFFNLFEFTQGLESEDVLAQLYLMVVSNIEGWVDVSCSMCKVLASRGLLLQNINHLQYLRMRDVENSEVLLSATETHLSIVYNCARYHPLPDFYFNRVNWLNFLSAWENSLNTGLRITCKLLVTSLAIFFPESERNLDIDVNDVHTLAKAMEDSVLSPDSFTEAFGYRYSTLELLQVFNSLSHCPTIFSNIAKPSILVSLENVIQRGQTREKIESLILLWSLLMLSDIKKIVLTSHKTLLEYIESELSEDKDEEVCLWGKGVTALVQASSQDIPDDSLMVAMIKCCYAARKYTECEQMCSKMPHSAIALLFKGKALYCMYRNMQRRLRGSHVSMTRKDFFSEHKACYDMAKEVVKILGRMKDSGEVTVDASIQKMFDFAMIDYLLETNKLKDLKRCFLCLKKPGLSKPPELESCQENTSDSQQSQVLPQDMELASHSEELACTADEAKRIPAKAQSSGKNRETIHASHLIPHSIMKRLAKDAPQNAGSKNVVFGVFGTKSENVMLRTPASCTIYMLCTSCEHLLNVKGEQPSLSFFEKLYDPTLHDKNFVLAYGKELYHFCIGLIFRTLCPSQDDYINTDEVYGLLVNCRAFLTGKSHPNVVITMPDVYMFICPVNVVGCDASMSSFLVENSVSYTSKISLDCPLEALGTFESVLANFFMVKVGLIVILVKFTPTAKQNIASEFRIDPTGGSYSVPASGARKDLIPTGMWTALCLLHDVYKDDLEKVNAGNKESKLKQDTAAAVSDSCTAANQKKDD